MKGAQLGEASLDSERAFLDQSLEAAAVVCRTEYGNLHAGILYRTDQGANVLNLGFQDRLYVDWGWPRLWSAPDCEPELLFHAAATCRRIWELFVKEKKFPYGIGFGGSSFDETGRLVLAAGAKGLTCATLVLAVFKSANIDLVDGPSWPVRKVDDLAFLDLLRPFAEKEHMELLAAEVEAGVKRIWPDEVVGACACALPAKFEPARSAADALLVKLDTKRVEAVTADAAPPASEEPGRPAPSAPVLPENTKSGAPDS